MQTYKFFIGIDVSKSWIDIAYYKNSKGVYLGRFSNAIEGFKKMKEQLSTLTDVALSKWFICFENTGSYSKLLLSWSYSQAINCKEENALRIKRSLGLKRGHEDRLDSKTISEYAYLYREHLSPSIPASPTLKKLRKLLSRRALLVRHKTAILVSFKEHKTEYAVESRRMIEKQNKALITEFNRSIQEVEDQINTTIEEDEEMRCNNQLVQSVKGIGPVISAHMIAYTDNFTRFENARQFSSYCGVAPFPNSSGSSKRGKAKVSHLANKKIKTLLANGANSAINHDKELKLYYERKRKEGKEYGTVINAVKNKLLSRIFAVVKRGTPWVAYSTYA